MKKITGLTLLTLSSALLSSCGMSEEEQNTTFDAEFKKVDWSTHETDGYVILPSEVDGKKVEYVENLNNYGQVKDGKYYPIQVIDAQLGGNTSFALDPVLKVKESADHKISTTKQRYIGSELDDYYTNVGTTKFFQLADNKMITPVSCTTGTTKTYKLEFKLDLSMEMGFTALEFNHENSYFLNTEDSSQYATIGDFGTISDDTIFSIESSSNAVTMAFGFDISYYNTLNPSYKINPLYDYNSTTDLGTTKISTIYSETSMFSCN